MRKIHGQSMSLYAVFCKVRKSVLRAIRLGQTGAVLSLVAMCCPVLDRAAEGAVGTQPAVVDMGVVTASQVAGGFGLGISQLGYTQDWEFAAAKAAGASWIRIQCSWSSVEQQTAPPLNTPASTRFVQTPDCAAALTSAAKYGLKVTIVGAFGPPYHQILYVTLPNGAAAGATSLQIAFQAGLGGDTLSNISAIKDYWCPLSVGDNGQANSPYNCIGTPTAKSSTQGALITSVSLSDATHGTIGLASALKATMPPNPGTVTGCSLASGSGVLTCTQGKFTPSLVGQTQVVIPGAGGGGTPFEVGIQSYISPNQVTIPCCAPTSVTNVSVQVNQMYAIGEILYPSAATQNPTDPSVVAYGDYVHFLATDMAARGVQGEIEIWNEPPWAGDPWDFRPYLYDYANSGSFSATTAYGLGSVVTEAGTTYISLTANNLGNDPAASPLRWSSALPPNAFTAVPTNGANFGFAANLQNRSFPAGVTAVWNGTSGNGMESLLAPVMKELTGATLNQPSSVITRESFHPYGGSNGNPEEMMGLPSCLAAAAASSGGDAGNPYNCYLPGQSNTANMMYAVFLDDKAKLANASYGIGHSITETNTEGNTAGQRLQQARFDMRHFLGFEAMGVTPIEFFQLWDDTHNDPSFSFVDYGSGKMSPFANYTAMSGLMADLQPIRNAPVQGYSAATLPAVAAYSGTYPLTAMHMVGSRSGATGNSDAFVVWQLSACLSGGNCWVNLSTPAGTAAVQIPATMKVTSVTDLISRAAVSYSQAGQQITFAVGDDPIEVITDPVSTARVATSMTLSTSSPSSSYGAQVVLTAGMNPYNSSQQSTNGESVSFFSGATQLGSGALSSGVATLDVTSLPIGVNTLQAVYAGDTNFSNSSASASITITGSPTTLAFAPIANQTYGAAPFSVQASSASPAAVTYAVVSGPATVAGNVVSLTGTGTVVLSAAQAATGTYLATSTQTSFAVAYAGTTLSFTPVANQVYGSPGFAVKATSASSGTVTYGVVSGPATIAGNVVALTGVGTVVLSASQPASGKYAADATQTSFLVTPENAVLSFAPIANSVYGSPGFTVKATSASFGSVTYGVVSGPATVSGNVVTPTGVGTVVLSASQPASGNYAAAATQTNFSVTPEATTLSFAPVANQVYGSPSFTVKASSASYGSVTYGVVSGPATVSGNVVTPMGVGTVVLSASQPASGNYGADSAQTSFTVSSASTTLSFAPVASRVYGSPSFTVKASSASSGAVTYGVVSGPATVSGNTVTLTGAGTVVLSASQPASGNYAADATQTSFTVTPVSTALSFAPIASQVFGAGTFAVNASSASAGTVTYGVLSGPAIVSGNTVTLTGVGTVVLSASQQASGNYASATAQTSFPVSATSPVLASATLVFTAIPNSTYGTAPFAAQASSASTAVVRYAVVSGPATIVGNTVTLTGVGNVVLSASQIATSKYFATSTQTSFTVLPVVPTLTFASIPTQVYGAPAIQLSATSASSGAVTYAVVSGPATILGNSLVMTGAGTVTLRASQAANGDYAAATTATTFSVTPATTTLAFAAVPTQRYGAPVTISATSASPGTISYTVASGPATVSGNQITLTGLGTVVLGATQAASGNFAAATAKTSFRVLGEQIGLAFTPIPTQTLGGAAFAVAASSVSPGSITYSVESGPATIAGNTVTATGVGLVVLQARQAASGNYAAGAAKTAFHVAAPVADFKLSADGPNSVEVAAGGSVVMPLTLTALNRMTGKVDLTCLGAPAQSTCTANPAQATLGAPVHIALTISTKSATTTVAAARHGQPRGGGGSTAFAATPFFLLLGLRRRPFGGGEARRLPRLGTLLFLCFLAVGVGSFTGCGTLHGQALTPGGAYQLTANGTTAGMTHSVDFTVVVE